MIFQYFKISEMLSLGNCQFVCGIVLSGFGKKTLLFPEKVFDDLRVYFQGYQTKKYSINLKPCQQEVFFLSK